MSDDKLDHDAGEGGAINAPANEPDAESETESGRENAGRIDPDDPGEQSGPDRRKGP